MDELWGQASSGPALGPSSSECHTKSWLCLEYACPDPKKGFLKNYQNFTFLQIPKSVSLTWPSLVSITLSGFRSLCTIPLKDHKHKQHQQLVRPRTSPCKNSRASVISAVKNLAVDSGKWPIWVSRKFGRLCNVFFCYFIR